MNPLKRPALFWCAVPLILSILLLGCGGELSPTPHTDGSDTPVAGTPFETLVAQAPPSTPTPTPTEAPSPTPEPTSTPTEEPTATPEPSPTPKNPEPTATPTQEIVPSNEICAVGELTGRCYQRTEMRKGVFPNGHVEPDGTMAIYASDPDRRICGAWMIGGRVTYIDLVNNAIHLQGKGTDIVKMRIVYDSPYFYSRMKRWVFDVPWREANPEVRPVLGRDIIVGDYINVTCVGADIKNSRTPDENYQKVMEAVKAGVSLWTSTVQIYQ